MAKHALTPEQARWIRRAKRLFREVPIGLEFFATGDPHLYVLDATKHDQWDSTYSCPRNSEDYPLNLARDCGAIITQIYSVAPIHAGAY